MIVKIKKKDKQKLLNDLNFWKQKSVPLSQHKLISLCQNPYIDDEDVVSYYYLNEAQEIISYLTIVGGQNYDTPQNKFSFMSSWWSHPEVRGIGAKLMLQAVEDYDGRVVSHLFDPRTLKIYERSQEFSVFRTYNIHYLNLSFSVKNKWNKALDLWPPIKVKNNEKREQKFLSHFQDLRVEFIQDIDLETHNFLQPFYQNNIFKREKESFDWMHRYPWVLSNPVKKIEISSPYFFTSTERYSEIFYVKIYKENTLVAFLALNVNNKYLKVGYVYTQELDTQTLSQFLLYMAYQLNVGTIITTEQPIIDEIRASEYFYSLDISERYTVQGKNMNLDKFQDKKIHMGDGEFLCT